MTLSFHPTIQQAYSSVHDWLVNQDDTEGYMKIDERKISGRLDYQDMKHIAAQFSVLFPAHYFKSKHILVEIIQKEMLLRWLKHNPYITLIDMGCGAGAASAAFISTLLDLMESGDLAHPVNLLCIGVDLVENVLGIYYQLLNHIKDAVQHKNLFLEIRIVDRPVAESVTDLDIHLRDILQFWDHPSLSHVIMMQSNIMRPLSSLHSHIQERRERLQDLGIPRDTFTEEENFGAGEARSYHQIFQQVPIDHLHIFTIGTDDQLLIQRVEEMSGSIQREFSEHHVEVLNKGSHHIEFENPNGSYWKETRDRDRGQCDFCIDITTITNIEWQRDKNWHDVIAIENLQLAWARVRAILIGDVLRDEMEIRIFEQHLDSNLDRLQQELIAYANQVAQTDDRLQYFYLKNAEVGRPRVLSRMDEDILSVAIIQVLGGLTFGLQNNSYAYRPNPSSSRPTEYLYEYWFEAYRRFTREIRAGVESYPGCKVLRVDIKSYFTDIQQQRLVEAITREFRSQSDRITWLIRKLLLVDLDSNTHRPAHGLSQGGAGSGFYANAYLTPVDVHFGVNNPWEVKLYRFVDDIVLVIPNPDELPEIRAELETILVEDLGLELNPDKEEIYDSAEYLLLPDQDEELNALSDRFEHLTNCLWLMDSQYRDLCNRDGNWWSFVDNYRNKLRSIDFFVDASRLSRKLHQYLRRRKRDRDLHRGRAKQLVFPSLDAGNWSTEFLNLNPDWNEERGELRNQLLGLIETNYNKLLTVNSSREQRRLGTRIYFCTNRLTRLGFQGAEGIITKILIEQPWIIRQPQHVIRNLAIQGFLPQLVQLLNHYTSDSHPSSSYFNALILHSIQFLEEIPSDVLQKVALIATDASRHPVERLMATETWLRLDCVLVSEYIGDIQNIAISEHSARLQKNYVLLLGKCEPTAVVGVTTGNNDTLLHNAYALASNGNIEHLFAEEEPSIIRERFYSGEYPDDSREFNEMGY